MVQDNYEYKYFICVIVAVYALFFISNIYALQSKWKISCFTIRQIKKTKTNLTNGLDKGTEEGLLWCDLQMLIISMCEV